MIIYMFPVPDEEWSTSMAITGQPDEDYWMVWLIQPTINNVTLFS